MSGLAALFDLYANLDPEGPYWPADDDTGEDYCLKHAREAAGPEGQVDGGYSRESDTCSHCTKCGKLLTYTLTNYGADAELDHFRTVKFRRDKPLSRETAYHLARMLYAKDGDWEAAWIAARAIRCMKRIPKFPLSSAAISQ